MAEGLHPAQQFEITGRIGSELACAEQPPDRIEDRGVVSVAVRVDSCDNLRCYQSAVPVLVVNRRRSPTRQTDKTVKGSSKVL